MTAHPAAGSGKGDAMFYLPKNTKEATWMQAPDSNPSGFKWWIAALSDQHLFTLWGKGQLEQGKTIAYNSFEANRAEGLWLD